MPDQPDPVVTSPWSSTTKVESFTSPTGEHFTEGTSFTLYGIGDPAADPPKCTCWLGTDSTFGDSYQRMKCAVHGESAQVIDPAEHAAHALIVALGTLDQEIAKVLDLPREQQLARANQLRKILKRAWADVTRVTDNAGDKVDQIVERLR